MPPQLVPSARPLCPCSLCPSPLSVLPLPMPSARASSACALCPCPLSSCPLPIPSAYPSASPLCPCLFSLDHAARCLGDWALLGSPPFPVSPLPYIPCSSHAGSFTFLEHVASPGPGRCCSPLWNVLWSSYPGWLLPPSLLGVTRSHLRSAVPLPVSPFACRPLSLALGSQEEQGRGLALQELPGGCCAGTQVLRCSSGASTAFTPFVLLYLGLCTGAARRPGWPGLGAHVEQHLCGIEADSRSPGSRWMASEGVALA